MSFPDRAHGAGLLLPFLSRMHACKGFRLGTWHGCCVGLVSMAKYRRLLGSLLPTHDVAQSPMPVLPLCYYPGNQSGLLGFVDMRPGRAMLPLPWSERKRCVRQVRVIDKAAAQPLDHSRALGIHARTLEVFEQFGIVDAVVQAGSPLGALNMCSSRGSRGRVELSVLKTLDTPYPMVLGLPQAQTEALLGKRMEALVRTRDQGRGIRV